MNGGRNESLEGGESGRVSGDKGDMVLTFQLHMCHPDWRADTTIVETDLTAMKGSCSRDRDRPRPPRSSSTFASSVVLASVQGSATMGGTSILETVASLRDSTNFKVSSMLGNFSSFNAFFLESGCSNMVDLVFCFQNKT